MTGYLSCIVRLSLIFKFASFSNNDYATQSHRVYFISKIFLAFFNTGVIEKVVNYQLKSREAIYLHVLVRTETKGV